MQQASIAECTGKQAIMPIRNGYLLLVVLAVRTCSKNLITHSKWWKSSNTLSKCWRDENSTYMKNAVPEPPSSNSMRAIPICRRKLEEGQTVWAALTVCFMSISVTIGSKTAGWWLTMAARPFRISALALNGPTDLSFLGSLLKHSSMGTYTQVKCVLLWLHHVLLCC